MQSNRGKSLCPNIFHATGSDCSSSSSDALNQRRIQNPSRKPAATRSRTSIHCHHWHHSTLFVVGCCFLFLVVWTSDALLHRGLDFNVKAVQAWMTTPYPRPVRRFWRPNDGYSTSLLRKAGSVGLGRQLFAARTTTTSSSLQTANTTSSPKANTRKKKAEVSPSHKHRTNVSREHGINNQSMASTNSSSNSSVHSARALSDSSRTTKVDAAKKQGGSSNLNRTSARGPPIVSSPSSSSYRGGGGSNVSIRTLLDETRQKRRRAALESAASAEDQQPIPPLTQAYCDYLLAECVAHDEWDVVLDVLDLMKESHLTQVHSTYTACLQACFQVANAASAREILSAMTAARIPPSSSDYALAILAMCRKDQTERGWWRKGLALLRKYTESLTASLTTTTTATSSPKRDDLPLAAYDAILTCMVQDRQWKEAIRLLRSMEVKQSPPQDILKTRPALSTYRTVIECCVASNEAEQAVQVLQSCVSSSGLTPTPYAFELVIGALTKKLQWRRAVQLLDLMEELKVPRSLSMYNFILASCAKAKEAVQAKQILQRMRRRDGIAPNIISYNSVMSACASTSRWRDALVVLDVAQREPGITPDVYTYTNAIRACAKGGKTQRALSLFQVVKDKGLPLDSYCYTAAIEACDWKQALKLLGEMEEQGMEPTEVAYSVTIKACGDSGQWRKALDLVDTMRNRKIPVNLYVYNAAITAISKAAKLRIKNVDGDADNNLWTEVLALLDQMRKDGIEPDGFSFSSAISCCGSEGRWEEALNLIDAMLKGGPKTRPNKIAYTAAISSCGRAGKVEHALRLFRQMKEQGLSADRVAYNALFSALRVSKKSEAAFELWDEMLGHPSTQNSTSRVAMARSWTNPDIITLTDAVGAMSSQADDRSIQEKIDAVFTEAVRLGVVFREDSQFSPFQYDLTSMSFPVARAACRFVLHRIKAQQLDQKFSDLHFVTGVGSQRQAGSISLRDYVQAVLLSDFNPSIASAVPREANGSIVITAGSLAAWASTRVS